MKLTRKGFFGTLAAAIFGAPVAAKAAVRAATPAPPSKFDVLYGLGSIKTHPLAFHRDAFAMICPKLKIGETITIHRPQRFMTELTESPLQPDLPRDSVTL